MKFTHLFFVMIFGQKCAPKAGKIIEHLGLKPKARILTHLWPWVKTQGSYFDAPLALFGCRADGRWVENDERSGVHCYLVKC